MNYIKKQEIMQHYYNIIDNLLKNSSFFDAYLQSPFMLDEDICGEDCNEMPDNLSLRCGATRACLIDSDYDWVVKIDIEDDALGYACEREMNIYNAARKASLQDYFSEVVYLGTYTRFINFYRWSDMTKYIDLWKFEINTFDEVLEQYEEQMEPVQIQINLPLYAYRRANRYDCGPVSDNLRADAYRVGSPLRSRNIAVATAFILEYGMDAYKAISKFGLDWDINDLHLGNVGEIDGHMVLIDYSGYHSGDCFDDEDTDWLNGSEDEENEEEEFE